ncbi:cytochrome P450 monooxygenase [Sparassis latifolia]
MFTSVLQSVLICAVIWISWRKVLRHFVMKSPFNNLPGPPSQSFWTGNIGPFVNRHGWDFHLDVARNYGRVVNLKGFLGEPTLYVYDPKALHNIVVKDQYFYEEPRSTLQFNHLLFGPGLLATLGDVHRKQRKILNPAFSVAHMRYMLPIFYNIANKLQIAIASRVANGPGELDILGWMSRTALELIGQGGLGYSFDPLIEDASDEFGDALKTIFPVTFSLGLVRYALPYLMQLGPASLRRRLVGLIPNRRVQRIKSAVDTLEKRSREIFDAKKAALLQGDEAVMHQIGEGRDIMSVLIKANMAAKSEEDKLPEDQLLGQMAILTFAAMDTTSNTLAQILQYMALRPDVQDKLRTEIIEARNGGELSYDALMQLPYLDAICRETLRVHPAAPIIERKASKDMILPLSAPIRGVNGEMINEVPVPKGTRIFVGVMGSNLSKALWGEDALEWKPERWLSPLPTALTDAHIPGVYSNLMTFMGGGRACIGFKFSEMEMKVVLSVLLPSFTFEITEKPILWNLAGVRYPTIGAESLKAEMPLKVGLFKESDA